MKTKETVMRRDRMVRDLSPDEAGSLLVHAHVISPERRKALLFRRGPASVYFKPDEIEEIKRWIDAEDFLPQDSEYEHPKRPTHWCAYHGDVVTCECDNRRRNGHRGPRNELESELLGRVVAAEACLSTAIEKIKEARTILEHAV